MSSRLKGSTLITGAAGGIGMGLVSQILQSQICSTHHFIYLYYPSAPGNLEQYLKQYAPPEHSYEVVPLDLSRLESIKTFTTSLTSRISSKTLPKLTNLFLIHGIVSISSISSDGVEFTQDRLEMTFAVNYLASVLMILNLLPAMEKGGGQEARIVFMSSTTHDPKWPSNRYGHFKDTPLLYEIGGLRALAEGRKEKVKSGDVFGGATRRYGTSKLLMNMFMYVYNKCRDNFSCTHHTFGASQILLPTQMGKNAHTNKPTGTPSRHASAISITISPLPIPLAAPVPNSRS